MNGKRLQVLFISSWYPNKVRPLLGIFVERHAKAIGQLCDVSSVYVYASDIPSIEEGEKDGIYSISIGYKKVTNDFPLFSQFLKIKRYIGAYKKAASIYKEKKGKPDIVNLNVIFYAGVIAMYLKRKWKVPYVITEHWTGYFPEDGRYKGMFMKFLAKKTVKNASAIITVSKVLKNKMLEVRLNNEYHVISNVVDTQLFNVPTQKIRKDTISFIHISSLDDAQKNASGIIRAFQKLHNSFPNTILTIVGDGTGKAKLVELCKSLGLDEVIHFAGQKTGVELTGLLQQSDAFVLFSNYENLPCVMLEALSCGIPIIGTRVGDVADYINPFTGILIEPRNEQQLVDAMTVIVKDRNRFSDAMKIRASVVDKVNSETIAKQFVDVYNKVLNRS